MKIEENIVIFKTNIYPPLISVRGSFESPTSLLDYFKVQGMSGR